MAKEIMFFLLLLINSVCFACITDNNHVLTLPDGKIQGTTYVTTNNIKYFGFRGIPYAKPPLGDLRFEPPQAVQPWSGILDTSIDGNSCISDTYLEDPEFQNEDCLFINVYVPIGQSEEKLPVMFYIPGGGFINGNSSKSDYGPDFLIEENVVVVTHNYRVGPFGFISTGDKALPGNMGLKDQNLALKWTKKNIEYFGGDPEKITIVGQSAGGASIGLHLLSKQSAGLFRAAIVQSGSATNDWAVDQDPKTTACLISDAIPNGNYGNDTQALKAFLKNKNVKEIMTAVAALPDGTHSWPTLEEESESAFMTESTYGLLESGNFSQVPIIIGICSQESLMFLKNLDYAKTKASLLDAEPMRAIPIDLYPNSTDKAIVAEEIKNIYLKNGQTFLDNLPAFADFYTDYMFTKGVIKHAELSSKYVPVYFYEYGYYGRPLTPAYIDGAEKAGHSSEIPFLFKMDIFNESQAPADMLTQHRMVKLWTNFIKYLNPTPEKADLFESISWPFFDNKNYTYLNINNTLEIRTNVREKYYPKWNAIYENYGRKPYITF